MDAGDVKQGREWEQSNVGKAGRGGKEGGIEIIQETAVGWGEGRAAIMDGGQSGARSRIMHTQIGR